MKKFYFLMAASVVALSACTSEEVVQVSPQNTITFQNVVNKGTRALTTNNFGLFYVYGYYTKAADLNTRFNIFTDTPVTKGDNGWTASINRYWIDGATYSFYAYSCENKHIAPEYGGPSIGQSDGVFRLNYNSHVENGVSHDLLFASSTEILGKESGNQPVTMQFKHILSKIDLCFISEFPEGYNIEISNISISAFKNSGTYVANKKAVSDGTLGEWTLQEYSTKTVNTFNLNTRGNAVTFTGGDPIESSECYMIPFHYGTNDNPVKIQFNIKVTNPFLAVGSQTIVSNTLVGTWHPNWRPGTQYTYNIHLSGGAAGMDSITFGVGIDDWNNPNEDNKPEDINISLDYQINPTSDDPSTKK